MTVGRVADTENQELRMRPLRHEVVTWALLQLSTPAHLSQAMTIHFEHVADFKRANGKNNFTRWSIVCFAAITRYRSLMMHPPHVQCFIGVASTTERKTSRLGNPSFETHKQSTNCIVMFGCSCAIGAEIYQSRPSLHAFKKHQFL